ncbi:MraY family glycosyltransferase [Leptolyngbya ohadii]|uniref:MraY family glycosyltransferase n=1 Tax=Leptolyngbya ohadii TaxID=1962290 RepID=UPI0015C588ED|nr:MraY family glycosyltransferase [Leptolyngbya ohadii]
MAPFIAATATLGITPLVQTLGLRWGWVDQPGKRKIHHQPIVRVGGIAIFAGTVLPVLLLLTHQLPDPSTNLSWQIAGILLGGSSFFLIGWLDDLFQISPFKRLFLQGLVACLCWLCGVRVETLPLPFMGAVPIGLLSLPITFLWLAGVANAINWMDGLDGLAGGVGAIAAVIFGLICGHHPCLSLIAFTLAGALAGFLRYNLNPARIFMGDGGSYFIGFTLAAIGAVGFMQASPDASPALPFWILAVPIGDMVRVILSRLWERKSPFYADQRHLHHKLLQINCSVQTAASLVWSLTAWMGAWVLLAAAVPLSAIVLLLTTVLLVILSYPLWYSHLLAPQQSR